MPLDTPTHELDYDLLKSRFDNAHLVRVDGQSRLIAVWNGSETINVYTFTLDEIPEGPHAVPRNDDGTTATHDEINAHIETIFQDYR